MQWLPASIFSIWFPIHDPAVLKYCWELWPLYTSLLMNIRDVLVTICCFYTFASDKSGRYFQHRCHCEYSHLFLYLFCRQRTNSAVSWAWSVLLNYEEACASERYEFMTGPRYKLWRNCLFTFNLQHLKVFLGLNHKLLNYVEKICLIWTLQL